MTTKTAFWALVAAYYVTVAVRLVRAALRRRDARRLADMTPVQRAAYARYWRGCF